MCAAVVDGITADDAFDELWDVCNRYTVHIDEGRGAEVAASFRAAKEHG